MAATSLHPRWRTTNLGVAVSALALLVATFLLPGTGMRVRATVAALETVAHSAVRTLTRTEALAGVAAWPRLSSAHFVIHYPAGQEPSAEVVDEVAEQVYPRIAADFGLPAQGHRWPIIVAPRAVLARDVGSTAANAPLGAYYEGIVWLLPPAAVLPAAGDQLLPEYGRDGPVAHELTHLADDLTSGGRIPVWLDEGLAQYEEWRLTGYVWMEADSAFTNGTYPWAQLTGQFDQLPDDALAYREALAATAVVCRQGPGACVQVLAALRAGVPLDRALEREIGAAGLRGLENGAAWKPGTAPEPGTVAGPAP